MLRGGGLLLCLAGSLTHAQRSDIGEAKRSSELARVMATRAETTLIPVTSDIIPPPFILPSMILDHLLDVVPFTTSEEDAADFNGNLDVDIGDFVTRLNQLNPGS